MTLSRNKNVYNPIKVFSVENISHGKHFIIKAIF